MSEMQIQALRDIVKMAPRVNYESLASIRSMLEQIIDHELLKLEPTVALEDMDITEKVMYLDVLNEKQNGVNEDSIPLEELLKKEGLTFEDIQDNT